MGLISKFGAGMATVAMLTGGCAEAKGPEAGVQDTQPRIMGMDYNAATNSAVMELCRMANVGSLPGVRDCHLVRADFSSATEGGVVPVTAVADAPGYKTSLPVFTPAGDAVYAVRRRSADWTSLGFRSPLEVVRIDLATREVVVIANGGPGTLSVADVIIGGGGREQLVMFENQGVNERGLPTNGRVVLMTVENGRPVEGSRRNLDHLTAGGLEVSLSGKGYVKGAIEQVERRAVPKGFMAFTPANLTAGAPDVLPDPEAAVTEATGCAAGTCTDEVAQRAHAVLAALRARPTYDTARLRGVGTTVENVVAAFPDRPPAYFPDDVDPFGAYRLDYDLAGGAVATPSGPQPDPSRVPFTLMGGEAVPFRPVMSGYLDLAGYAAGKL